MAKDYGREIWDGLVEHVAIDDGLPVVETAGFWTRDKLFFLCKYLEQTTRGMKRSRSKFAGGLAYIDLFCGPGVSAVQLDSGGRSRLPGSPVIAAAMPTAFDQIVLVDRDADAVAAAQTRIDRICYEGTVRSYVGDANSGVDQVIALLPDRALNVTFIDPFALDIHFTTIRRIAHGRALDLIVLVADRFDASRNWREYYYPQEDSKLDRFLGISGWRERVDQLGDQSWPRVRDLFLSIYRDQLSAIGYKYIDVTRLHGPKGPVFSLLFASKHELGGKYWSIAKKMDYFGAGNLFE